MSEFSAYVGRIVISGAKDRHGLICVGVLLLIWLIVWIPRLSGPIDLRWDASTYYVLGTALAEGKGYRLLNEPGDIEAVQYTPLLPLIVAAHQRLMGTSDYFRVGSALRITYFLLSALFLFAAYALARKLLPPLYALLVGVMTALSFYGFFYPSDTLYAEMPFAVISMMFLLCYEHGDRAFGSVGLGFLGAIAYLLRTAGLALLFAWVAESLIRRRFWQAAIRITISAVPILLWQAHVWRVTRSHDYQHPFYSYQRAPYNYSNVPYGENSKLLDAFRPEFGRISSGTVARRIARNFAAIPLSLGESALVPSEFRIPGHGRKSSYALRACLVAAGAAAIVGAGLVATGRQWFLSLYFTAMAAVITLTPWQNQFWRYFAPVTPLTLTFLMFAGFRMRYWLGRRSAKWGRTLAAIITAPAVVAILLLQIIVATYFLHNMRPISYYDYDGRERTLHLLTYESPWHAIDPAFEWIRRHAAVNAVVATAVPHLAYIRSGHKAVLPPFELNPAMAQELLDQVPVSYLVLDEIIGPLISQHYAAPLVAENPDDWRLVFTAPDQKTRVYERVRRNVRPKEAT
jgi:hypothetical protein